MLLLRRQLAVAVTTSLALLGVSPGAAASEPTVVARETTIEIDMPSKVDLGYKGPIYLRGDSSYEDNVFHIEIDGPGDYAWSKVLWKMDTYDQPYYFPAFKRPGTYEVEVTSEYSSATDNHSIKADYASPAFALAELSRDAFHPRVHDGYQDQVIARWRTNRSLFGSIAILNAENTPVRTWPERIWSGDERQAWDGKTGAGITLPVGRYRIRLTARDADGRSVTETLPVSIRRGSGR